MQTPANQAPVSRRIISFYLPLERPMAFPTLNGIVNPRPEEVTWLKSSTLPKPFNEPIFKASNFVAFNPYQIGGKRVIDSKPLALSKMAAEAVQRELGPGTQMEWPDDIDVGMGLRYTTLRMTTAILDDGVQSEDECISAALSRCFESLRSFEIAYIVASKDIAYPFTTSVSSASSCFFNIYDLQNEAWSDPSYIVINTTDSVRLFPPDVSESVDVSEVAYRTHLARVGFPLTSSEYWFRQAERSLYLLGTTEVSSLQAFTAGEIYLDSLLMMLAWENIAYMSNKQGLTIPDVALWYSYKNDHGWRVNSKFRDWLRGWDQGASPRVPERWIDVAAKVRSRVVHTGYVPSFAEAAVVHECYSQIVEFTKELLVSDRNRSRYPRTACMVLGEIGLKRFDVYSGSVKTLFESGDLTKWTDEFIAFQDAVRVAIERPPARAPKAPRSRKEIAQSWVRLTTKHLNEMLGRVA